MKIELVLSKLGLFLIVFHIAYEAPLSQLDPRRLVAFLIQRIKMTDNWYMMVHDGIQPDDVRYVTSNE